jgi:hypothetical protein
MFGSFRSLYEPSAVRQRRTSVVSGGSPGTPADGSRPLSYRLRSRSTFRTIARFTKASGHHPRRYQGRRRLSHMTALITGAASSRESRLGRRT